jgi:hypothetical protein
MKIRRYLIVAAFCLSLVGIPWGKSGPYTTKRYFYIPPLVAGSVEWGAFSAGLEMADAGIAVCHSLVYTIGDPGCATIAAALAAIGSTNATLHLPAATYSIAINTTIPANIILKPEKGAIFSITTAITLTINSPSFDAGSYQVFSCTGTGKVVFANTTVNPYWWQPAGQADWTASFAAAIASCPTWASGSTSSGIGVSVPPGVYACNITLTRPLVTINGAGQGVTIFIPTAATSPVIQVGNGTTIASGGAEYCRISDFSIGYGYYGQVTTASCGIYVNGAYECSFDNFYIGQITGDGIKLQTTGTATNYFNHFTNFEIDLCQLAAIRSLIGTTETTGNNGCYFDHFTIHGSNYGSSATGAPAAGSGGPSYCLYLADNDTYFSNGYMEESSDCGAFLHNGGGFHSQNVTMDGISDGGSGVQVQFDTALTYPIGYYIRGSFDAADTWKFADGTACAYSNFYDGSWGAYLCSPKIIGSVYFPDTGAANYLGAGQFTDLSASISNSGGYLYLNASNGELALNHFYIKYGTPGLYLQDTTSSTVAAIYNNGGNLQLYPPSGKAVLISGPIQGLSTINGPVGGFTCAAGTSTVVSNTVVTNNSRVFLQPTNLAATVSTLRPYISAVNAGTSFTVTTVGASGTETFNYWVVN